jgi:hypothetical protein
MTESRALKRRAEAKYAWGSCEESSELNGCQHADRVSAGETLEDIYFVFPGLKGL